MERDQVITRPQGRSIGTASLIALVVLGALIALVIWQPWNGTVTLRSASLQTNDAAGGTR